MDLSLNREINVCDINPVHHLFAAGTIEVCVVLASEVLLHLFAPDFAFF